MLTLAVCVKEKIWQQPKAHQCKVNKMGSFHHLIAKNELDAQVSTGILELDEIVESKKKKKARRSENSE